MPDQPRWQCAAQVAQVADFAPTVPETGNTANGWHRTLPTNTANAAGQVPLSTERQREGEVEDQRKFRDAPDWPLIRQITRIVHAAPGGGLHRDDLAEKLGLPPASPVLKQALMIAYRRKQIDFVRQYVVKPVSAP